VVGVIVRGSRRVSLSGPAARRFPVTGLAVTGLARTRLAVTWLAETWLAGRLLRGGIAPAALVPVAAGRALLAQRVVAGDGRFAAAAARLVRMAGGAGAWPAQGAALHVAVLLMALPGRPEAGGGRQGREALGCPAAALSHIPGSGPGLASRPGRWPPRRRGEVSRGGEGYRDPAAGAAPPAGQPAATVPSVPPDPAVSLTALRSRDAITAATA
jgi:hypothetical protein